MTSANCSNALVHLVLSYMPDFNNRTYIFVHTHENVCTPRSAYHHEAFITIANCNDKFVIFLKMKFQVRYAAVDVRGPAKHAPEELRRVATLDIRLLKELS